MLLEVVFDHHLCRLDAWREMLLDLLGFTSIYGYPPGYFVKKKLKPPANNRLWRMVPVWSGRPPSSPEGAFVRLS
jgi:hypothetical protein